MSTLIIASIYLVVAVSFGVLINVIRHLNKRREEAALVAKVRALDLEQTIKLLNDIANAMDRIDVWGRANNWPIDVRLETADNCRMRAAGLQRILHEQRTGRLDSDS